MSGLLINLVLTLAWVMMTGVFSFVNIMAGFVLGYAVLALTQRVTGRPGYAGRLIKTISLIAFFSYELALANFRLTLDLIRPNVRIRPAIIAMPLSARTDFEITALANLITLTPGSTSIELSDDRKTLYVHLVDIGDSTIEEVRTELKRGFERRLLDVMR
jgi:multicomponent Na+:H+ antiporter subunit E